MESLRRPSGYKYMLCAHRTSTRNVRTLTAPQGIATSLSGSFYTFAVSVKIFFLTIDRLHNFIRKF